MRIEPLDAPKSDVTPSALAPPRGSKQKQNQSSTTRNDDNNINIGDDFGFGNDFASAVPSANTGAANGFDDDFGSFGDTNNTNATSQAQAQSGGNDLFGNDSFGFTGASTQPTGL